jgi:hypothetical protein
VDMTLQDMRDKLIDGFNDGRKRSLDAESAPDTDDSEADL